MKNVFNKNSLILIIIYLVILAVVNNSFKTGSYESFPLLSWVRDSSQPDIGLIFLSLAFTNIFWLLLSLGIFSEVSIGSFKLSGGSQNAPRLQIIVCTILALLSLGFLLIVPPACEIPIITFTVNTGSEVKPYTPESSVTVSGTKSIIVGVQPYVSTYDMDCEMQVMGEILDRFIQNETSCSTTIYLKDNTGSLIVSAYVKKKYCENVTFYNLSILKK